MYSISWRLAFFLVLNELICKNFFGMCHNHTQGLQEVMEAQLNSAAEIKNYEHQVCRLNEKATHCIEEGNKMQKELEDRMKKQRDDVDDLKGKLDNLLFKVKSLDDKREENNLEAKNDLLKKIRELNNIFNNYIIHNNKTIEQLGNRIKEYDTIIYNLTVTVNDKKEKLKKQKDVIKDNKDKILQHKQRIEKWKEIFEDQKRAHQRDMDDLNKTMNENEGDLNKRQADIQKKIPDLEDKLKGNRELKDDIAEEEKKADKQLDDIERDMENCNCMRQ